jgi:hypothetical protein
MTRATGDRSSGWPSLPVQKIRSVPEFDRLIKEEFAMPKTLFERLSRSILAAMGVCIVATAATAGGFTRGCAARDLQLLMTIEVRENTGTVPAEKLSDAMVEMMHARIVCHQGRVLDALALYDAIDESLQPILSGRAQAPNIR